MKRKYSYDRVNYIDAYIHVSMTQLTWLKYNSHAIACSVTVSLHVVMFGWMYNKKLISL